MRDRFDEIECELGRAYSKKDESAIKALQLLLNELIGPEEVTRLNAPYQGAVFNVGDPIHAAVHSEPEFDSARWFMSVVPGSRSQIMGLKQRWQK